MANMRLDLKLKAHESSIFDFIRDIVDNIIVNLALFDVAKGDPLIDKFRRCLEQKCRESKALHEMYVVPSFNNPHGAHT